jgi:hypothetical protein
MIRKVKQVVREMFNKKIQDESIVGGLFITMAILLFHVALLAGICLLVLFFHVIVHYLLWIVVGAGILIGGGGYLFLRHLRGSGSEALREVLSMPEFKGRSLEINFLGGLASLKIGKNDETVPQLPDLTIPSDRRIENEHGTRTRELLTLARLLEQDLISREEYQQAKKQLFD